MRVGFRIVSLAIVACSAIIIDEPIDPMSLGSVLGPGLQGSGTAAAPLDIKAGTTNGQTPAWGGTAWANNAYCMGDPSQRYCGYEEWESGTTGSTPVVGKFSGTATGTGASVSYSGLTDSGHPGITALNTGSTATGGERFSIGSTIVFGGNIGTFCTRWLFEFFALSNTTTEYLFRAGFAEPSANDGTNSVDAVQVVYDRPNTGDKYALQTCANSVCTLTVCDGSGGTTNAPVTATTWATAELCVNGAASSATLKINNVLCATNASNIPTGTARATSVGVQCHNRTGSVPANQACYIDYAWWSLPFGTAR